MKCLSNLRSVINESKTFLVVCVLVKAYFEVFLFQGILFGLFSGSILLSFLSNHMQHVDSWMDRISNDGEDTKILPTIPILNSSFPQTTIELSKSVQAIPELQIPQSIRGGDDALSPIHLWFREYTGVICSVVLLSLVGCLLTLPEGYRSWISSLFSLHDPIVVDPSLTLYGKDKRDVLTVLLIAIFLVGVRQLLCSGVFIYIARLMGISDSVDHPYNVHKTGENAWLVLYYSTSFLTGLRMCKKYLNLRMDSIWDNYPELYLPMDIKLFYLTQCAFYVQLLILVAIEKHRKDVELMFIHHTVTILLISASYYTNFVRVGLVVLAIFDAADALLPLAKIFQYAWWVIPGYSTFFLFTVTWVYTRHWLFLKIIWSVVAVAPTKLPLIWDPSNGYFCNYTWSMTFFLGILISLEIMQIVWLANILRLISSQILVGKKLGDDRSNRSDESDEE